MTEQEIKALEYALEVVSVEVDLDNYDRHVKVWVLDPVRGDTAVWTFRDTLYEMLKQAKANPPAGWINMHGREF